MNKYKTKKCKTKKYKTKKCKSKKCKSKKYKIYGGTSDNLSNNSYIENLYKIKQLSKTYKLPSEIEKIIRDEYIRHEYIIPKLKNDFINYSQDTDDEYDVKDYKLVELTGLASKFLTKKDINRFWKNIFAKIFMGLHNNKDSSNNNFNKNKKNFITLIKNIYKYNLDEKKFLKPPGDEFIYKEFLNHYLEHGY